MNTITYAAIVDDAFRDVKITTIGSEHSQRVENFLIASTMASRLDHLRREVRDNAAQMARRFADYVVEMDSVVSPLQVREPPVGWSNLPEMAKQAAQFDALVHAFKETFMVLSGISFVKAKRALEAERAFTGKDPEGSAPSV